MLTEKEAKNLMVELINLKTKYAETQDLNILKKLKIHEQKCINSFKYLVAMKTSKYKAFANYDDVFQEGMMGLIAAIKTFKADRGSFFGWALRYISTKVVRNANTHTAIKYPLKFAKENTPHKELIMPLMVEEHFCPDKQLEEKDTSHTLQQIINNELNENQRNVINMVYGFNGAEPQSINKICRTLNISRSSCLDTLDSSLKLIRSKIKI